MIQDDDGEQKTLKPFFRNPIMWCGLLLPFLFNSTNALHHYFNFVPSLALQTSVELFNRTASLNIRINFLMFRLRVTSSIPISPSACGFSTCST